MARKDFWNVLDRSLVSRFAGIRRKWVKALTDRIGEWRRDGESRREMMRMEAIEPRLMMSAAIVDDGGTGFSTVEGSWSSSTGSGYLSDYRTQAAGTGTHKSVYSFNLARCAGFRSISRVLMLIVTIMSLAMGVAAERVWGANESVAVEAGKPAWFSYGEELGEILPQEGHTDGCVVHLGKSRLRLDHQVQMVLMNETHCIFVGAQRLSVFRMNPTAEVVFSRNFPVGGDYEVCLADEKLIGCFSGGHLVWEWSLNGDIEWMLRQGTISPVMPLDVGGRAVFLTEDNLIFAREDGFQRVPGVKMRSAPRGAYSYGDRLVLLTEGEIGLFQFEVREKALGLEEKEAYEGVFPKRAGYFPIQTGEICMLGVEVEDEVWVLQLDMAKRQYRKKKVQGASSARTIFAHKGELYHSRHASKGPLISREIWEKVQWQSLVKINGEKR